MEQPFSSSGEYGAGRDGGIGLGLSGDFLLEMPDLFEDDVLNIGWSLGVGGHLGVIGDTNIVGVGGIAGLEFNFNAAPIDLVFEYRPSLLLSPAQDLDLIGFSAHLRVYPFK